MTRPVQRTLKGLTWDHTRGWAPMAVTSQVFGDHHPGVRINWDRQSLWAFGEQGIEAAADAYDLMVIDHPMVGTMATSQLFVPFDLTDAAPAVGASTASYLWEGRLWALPLDAACQVSVGRQDLLDEAAESTPRTWDAVLDLADRTRRVLVPLTPIDAFSSLLTLCADDGGQIGSTPDGAFLDQDIAVRALLLLSRLREAVPDGCLEANPIAVLEQLAGGDALFCPLVFGYSNYSRDAYAPHRLTFGETPRLSVSSGRSGGSLLGGAGIAVTAAGSDPDLATEYARWVTSSAVQQADFLHGGGQPAAVAAWDSDEADALTHGYFRATRPAVDVATVRPRDPAYPRFQTHAAARVHAWLTDGGDPVQLIHDIEDMYRARVSVAA